MSTPIHICCCYAHEDTSLLEKLKVSLEPFRRAGSISVWTDCDITAGAEWEKEIQKRLRIAQVILLLVSPAFLASDYCYGVEMKHALERHNRGEARVVPVILRLTHWQDVLGKLHVLPTNAKPVKDRYWHNLDEAFHDIAEGVRKVISELQEIQAIAYQTDISNSHDRIIVDNPLNRNTEKGSQLVKGADDFLTSIHTAPAESSMLLQKLCGWAVSLEQAQLAQLYTYHGKRGVLTLLPRLKVDGAGLVSIYNNHGSASIQFWRSVFERRAPRALAAIEALNLPIKQGNTSNNVSDSLLEILTEAYHEAVK